MTDPLDVSCDDIDVGTMFSPSTKLEPELFLDGDRFLSHLNRSNFTFFDVATFSTVMHRPSPLIKIRRLITALPLSREKILQYKEHRLVKNNHAKIYLCFIGDKLKVTYIGSHNLCHGRNYNIMVKVASKQGQELLKYFNQLWKPI